jgi:hypothetical protein
LGPSKSLYDIAGAKSFQLEALLVSVGIIKRPISIYPCEPHTRALRDMGCFFMIAEDSIRAYITGNEHSPF